MPIPENHDLRIHLAPTWLEKWDGPDRDSTRDNVISEDEIADSRLQIAGSIEPSLPTAKSAIAALKASDPVTAPEIAPPPARTCHCHRCGVELTRLARGHSQAGSDGKERRSGLVRQLEGRAGRTWVASRCLGAVPASKETFAPSDRSWNHASRTSLRRNEYVLPSSPRSAPV